MRGDNMFFSGMPGGRRSGPADTKLYDVMGVPSNASESDIKKAYYKLAKEFHPDKNPDHGDKFKEISFAYEILSNPEKRQMYDQVGLDGIKEGGGGGGYGEDLFSSMFGGDDEGMGGLGGFFNFGGGGGGRRRPQKHKDTVHPLNITLEEAYKGKTCKMKISRKALCPKCNGTGSKTGESVTCRGCKGRGQRMVMKQVGPGMIQQMVIPCTDCSGKGTSVKESDKCNNCKGERSVDESKTHEIPISPGANHGEQIKLKAQGNQTEEGVMAGDVVLVVQIQDHDTFKREGSDLLMERKISLNEALCGFEIRITHLDGRTVVLTNKPGQVIRPGTVLGVTGEGMPVNRHPELKGNLLVTFDVKFPEAHFLEKENEYAKLASFLPAGKSDVATPSCEEVSLMDFDEKKYGGRSEAYGEDDEEDEEMHGHGHGHGGANVQCAQS